MLVPMVARLGVGMADRAVDEVDESGLLRTLLLLLNDIDLLGRVWQDDV